MQLSTPIKIKTVDPKINYNSGVVLLGSCFAQHIGSKFTYFQFKNRTNPFGVLFHPKAIETFLWMTTQQEAYTEEDLFFYNEVWHCFDAHSSLSGLDKHKVLTGLNSSLSSTYRVLKTASHVVITLGTAWVYKLKQLEMVVANCHKIPQREFDKILLSIEDIKQQLQNCIAMLRGVQKDIKVILTVSPVRHVKDGMVENSRSKAHLLSAVHEVVYDNKEVFYFPSYEIMMDELRDYRFYKEDMVHPSVTAVKYIWEAFSNAWIEPSARQTMDRVDEIQKALQHKPFNPKSAKHQLFLEKLQYKKGLIQKEYPFMKFG